MNGHKIIAHLWNDTVQELSRLFALHPALMSFEDIHQARVRYKKTRALARLIFYLTGKRSRFSMPGSLRSHYRLLGDIRDRQVLQRRLIQESVTDLSAQQPIFQALQREIDHGLSDAKPQRIPGQFMRFGLHVGGGKGAFDLTYMGNRYLGLLVRSVYILHVEASSGDQVIHDIRKLLKDHQYVSAMLASAGIRSATEEDNVIVRFTEKLGAFQDDCMAVGLLNGCLGRFANSEVYTHLTKTARHWTDERDMKRRALLTELAVVSKQFRIHLKPSSFHKKSDI